MDIFKKIRIIFQNFHKNVFINCVFKTCIANISCYKIEQLKLHRSLLGVKGGGAKIAFSPTFNCNAKMQYFLLNFSQKYDKLNKHTWKMYIQI